LADVLQTLHSCYGHVEDVFGRNLIVFYLNLSDKVKRKVATQKYAYGGLKWLM
jgi:hypothetical protein